MMLLMKTSHLFLLVEFPFHLSIFEELEFNQTLEVFISTYSNPRFNNYNVLV